MDAPMTCEVAISASTMYWPLLTSLETFSGSPAMPAMAAAAPAAAPATPPSGPASLSSPISTLYQIMKPIAVPPLP